MRITLFACIAFAACTGVDASPKSDGAGSGGARLAYASTPDPFPALDLEPGRNLCTSEAGCILDGRVNITTPYADGVLIGGFSTLLLVDSTGRKIADIGRKGKGPGEFLSPMSADTSDNGEIRIFDPYQRRIVTFDRDRKYVSTIAATMPVLPMMMNGALIRSGQLYSTSVNASNDPAKRSLSYINTHGDGTATVRELTTAKADIQLEESGRVAHMLLFWPHLLWDVDHAGNLYVANGDAYMIRKLSRDAKELASISVDIPAVKVTQEMLDRELARRDAARREAGPKTFAGPKGVRMPTASETFRQQADMDQDAARNNPPFLPILQKIRALDDGTLWVARFTMNDVDSARWDAFSADGKPLGHAMLPRSATIRAGSATRILVQDTDSLDLPLIRWFTVRVY